MTFESGGKPAEGSRISQFLVEMSHGVDARPEGQIIIEYWRMKIEDGELKICGIPCQMNTENWLLNIYGILSF